MWERNPGDPLARRPLGPELSTVPPDPSSGDWNTCAQAAAATLLAPFALGPYSLGAIPTHQAATRALTRTHPPDMPLGFGTTAFGLARLLEDHGFSVRIVHSSVFGRRRESTLAQIEAHAAAGWPVPVCLDDGLLGGRAFEAHWALVHEVRGDHVSLSLGRSRQLPLEEFLTSWHCRHLPYTHNHCAILAER